MSDTRVWNVLIVGVGGQGIVTASDVLSRAAMEAGHDAKKSEIHGMSQRGGSVFSHVRFGGLVHSPLVPEGGADILLSLEELETTRWLTYAGPQTTLVVANARILPANTTTYPEGALDALRRTGAALRVVDVAVLQDAIGDPRYLNVAILGAIADLLPIPDTAWEAAIRGEVKPAHADHNWRAFTAARAVTAR